MDHNAIDAEIAACDGLSRQATQAGAHAFVRLLKLAEERDSGQVPRIARFLTVTPACAPSSSAGACAGPKATDPVRPHR